MCSEIKIEFVSHYMMISCEKHMTTVEVSAVAYRYALAGLVVVGILSTDEIICYYKGKCCTFSLPFFEMKRDLNHQRNYNFMPDSNTVRDEWLRSTPSVVIYDYMCNEIAAYANNVWGSLITLKSGRSAGPINIIDKDTVYAEINDGELAFSDISSRTHSALICTHAYNTVVPHSLPVKMRRIDGSVAHLKVGGQHFFAVYHYDFKRRNDCVLEIFDDTDTIHYRSAHTNSGAEVFVLGNAFVLIDNVDGVLTLTTHRINKVVGTIAPAADV